MIHTRAMRPSPRWSPFLLLGALGACGSTTGELSEEEFFRRYAEIACEGGRTCCAQGSHSFDESSCHLQIEEWQTDMNRRRQELGLSYDADQAAVLLERVRQSFETCTTIPRSAYQEDMAALYPGTKAQGEGCHQEAQCEAPLTCADIFSAHSGTCQPRKQEPDAPTRDCIGTWGCEEGQVCSASDTCEPGPEAGTPCPSTGCARGSYCDDTGHCAAGRGLGEACSDGSECGSEWCAHSVCRESTDLTHARSCID
ncbi:MAG: hypothetical protein EOO75_11875 [Myxococcales bacterium]|nr:MAG: hypothetical protein EOO75_11875 [Myxococcales bacterium]